MVVVVVVPLLLPHQNSSFASSPHRRYIPRLEGLGLELGLGLGVKKVVTDEEKEQGFFWELMPFR